MTKYLRRDWVLVYTLNEAYPFLVALWCFFVKIIKEQDHQENIDIWP